MYNISEILRISSGFRKNRDEKLVSKILDAKITYLSKEALLLLVQLIQLIEKKQIKGDIVEAGCALGGSSILIAKSKKKERPFKIFDSFELMPEPSENDEIDVQTRYKEIISGNSKGIGENLYYGYEKDLLEKVKQNFLKFRVSFKDENIQFIKGYYEAKLKFDQPIALAHIDCDWFDSVMVSLERITPHLTIGGFLIIDDYFFYSGCKKATDKYFSDKRENFKFFKKDRLVIERIR